jgi:hypothetical protein
VRLVHVEGIDLAQARREDFEVAGYLRRTNPALYQSLRTAVRNGRARGRR